MKKIIFTNIPMKLQNDKMNYVDEEGNAAVEFAVCFPAAIAFSKYISSNDDVKIVMIAKQDIENNSEKNVELLQKELQEVNTGIGAKISFKKVQIPFDESREAQEALLTHLVDQLEEGAETYADITFGTKSLPIIVFAALNFAEKFYNCTVKKVVYGKADFINGKATNGEFCNVTSLYYINSMTNTMEADTPQKAKEMLNAIIKM